MANKKYKLTDGDYWASDGVYDFDEDKTQRQVNADLKSAITDVEEDVSDLSSEIAYKNRTLLWTNPVSNNFEAGNIVLSSSDYDVLEVWFVPTNGATATVKIEYFPKSTRNIKLDVYSLNISNNSFYDSFLMSRQLTYVSETTYTASNGTLLRLGRSNATTTFNPYFEGSFSYFVIPLYIYGLKY